MNITKLLLKEIRFRKTNFLFGVVAVMLASSAFVGSTFLLRIHDWQTQQILQKKHAELEQRMATFSDDTRKTMLKLGFNLVILPIDQNLSDWYANDYATKYMPEDYVDKLANSGIITVRHFLPSLQQKIEWSEKKRKIILVGTRGEVPNLHKNYRAPLVEPVPKGTITLGYELHRSMGIKKGDSVQFMGRTFSVHQTYAERGNKDDITAWIHLQQAQSLLQKEGKINAILALECLCAGMDALPKIREQIAAILPGTQVIERGSRALARAEARFRVAEEAKVSLDTEIDHHNKLALVRERLASILTPIVIVACAIWIAILGIMNVRARKEETGILRALGITSKQIMVLFLSKHIIMGFLGGLIGFFIGVFSVLLFQEQSAIWMPDIFQWDLLIICILGATGLAILSGWIPTLSAVQQDPAEALREE